MYWKNFCFYSLIYYRKKSLIENFGLVDFIIDFFFMNYCFLVYLLIERGWCGGGIGVVYLFFFLLFYYGGFFFLNYYYVRLLLYYWLVVIIFRLWLIIFRLWLIIFFGWRVVVFWRRGRVLLVVRGWVGWLKNKIKIWFDWSIFLLY